MEKLTPIAIGIVEQIQKGQYLSAGAMVTYVYDYFLTFDREVEYIWKSRLSPVKILFILNRYFVIPNIIIQHFRTIDKRLNPAECMGLVQAFIFLTTFGTFFSETMLCIRLWVMWNKSKAVFIGLILIFVAISAYYITNGEISFNVAAGTASPFVPPSKGCPLAVKAHDAFVTFVILIVSDLAKVVLALIPTIQIHIVGRGFRTRIADEVFREGVFFYVILLVYSIIGLVLVLQSADNAIAIVPVFLVIRVVFASRMVLHIRQLYTEERFQQMTGSTLHTRTTTYM